jgi:hypothetical protein
MDGTFGADSDLGVADSDLGVRCDPPPSPFPVQHRATPGTHARLSTGMGASFSVRETSTSKLRHALAKANGIQSHWQAVSMSKVCGFRSVTVVEMVCVCVFRVCLFLDCLRVGAVFIGGMCVVHTRRLHPMYDMYPPPHMTCIGGMCVLHTRTLHTKQTGPHTDTHMRVRARTFMCSRARSPPLSTHRSTHYGRKAGPSDTRLRIRQRFVKTSMCRQRSKRSKRTRCVWNACCSCSLAFTVNSSEPHNRICLTTWSASSSSYDMYPPPPHMTCILLLI